MSFDVRTRISKLISSAKARGLHINLDVNKYQLLIDEGCFYCGNDLSTEKGYCLDRIDSSKGYTISNIVPCCKKCNIAKMNMSFTEFVDWLIKAGEHTKNKKINALNSTYSGESSYQMMDIMIKDKEKHRIKFVPE